MRQHGKVVHGPFFQQRSTGHAKNPIGVVATHCTNRHLPAGGRDYHLYRLFLLPPELRGRRRATLTALASESPDKAFYALSAGKVVGEKVRRVDLTAHFPQLYRPRAYLLLYTQGMRGDVSEFAQALPGADAYCSDAIRPHSDRQLVPRILQPRLLSKSQARCFDHPVELRLA